MDTSRDREKDARDAALRFGSIYRDQEWRAGGESLSGPGSDQAAAQPYVDFVGQVIQSQAVRSVLDIGHGDWAMWPDEAFAGVDYLGVDVAKGLSEKVSASKSNERRRFEWMDASQADLPIADAVLCKDVLQHLPNVNVAALLEKFTQFRTIIVCHDVSASPTTPRLLWLRLRESFRLRSRIRSVLTTGAEPPLTHRHYADNADIPIGAYRRLDIERPPWSLNSFGLKVVASRDFASHWGSSSTTKRIWHLESS
jgi:hypothetical protein